jgi:hypothetical protein
VVAGVVALGVFGGTVAWLAWGIRSESGRPPVPAAQPQQDDRTARNAFVADLRANCALLRRQREGVPHGSPLSDRLTKYSPETIRVIRRLEPAFASFAAELESLEVPPGDEDAAHIVERFQQLAEQGGVVVRQWEAGNRKQFERAAQDFWTTMYAAFLTIDDYVGAHGFEGCRP